MKRLFVDIETSPNKGYFWRAGYKQNVGWEWIVDERQILSAAWAWNNSKVEAKGWDWGKGAKGDYSLVKKLIDLSHEADEVIAHNGDAFDVPWIRARAVFYGMAMPDVVTIDTCKLARKKFFFNSNCLDYLCKLLFNKQKIKTDYKLWIDVMNGEQKALAKMIRYNKRDVTLLREVYNGGPLRWALSAGRCTATTAISSTQSPTTLRFSMRSGGNEDRAVAESQGQAKPQDVAKSW
jgi:DNA polymerase elongation subunit (family B)